MNSFNWLFKVDKHKNIIRILLLFSLIIIIIWRNFLFIKSFGENDYITRVGPLDFVAKLMMGDTLLLIFLPLYLFFANSFTSIKNEFILIRLHSRKSIWRNEMIAFCLSAFVFSFLSVMTTYIFSGLMIESYTNQWQNPTSEFAKMLAQNSPNLSIQSFLYTTPSVLLIYIIFTTLGFFSLGMIFAIAKLLFKNTPLVFVLLVVIIMLDSYSINGKSFSPYITLDYADFLIPFSILGKVLVTASVTLLFSLVGQILMNRRDFILSKKGTK